MLLAECFRPDCLKRVQGPRWGWLSRAYAVCVSRSTDESGMLLRGWLVIAADSMSTHHLAQPPLVWGLV
jgi:hypothetical protein